MQTQLDVTADDRVNEYFSDLKQVFLYITDECNLRCTQCYYKPWLKEWEPSVEMDTEVVLGLLSKFRERGANKLSILGGEPTLYGRAEGNDSLPFVIEKAREMGFEYIRIVTNGTFSSGFLLDDRVQKLDEITFSVDGDRPEIHDSLRGEGMFEKTTDRLKQAIDLGYYVQVTTCVHKGNVGRDSDGNYLVDRAIRWAESLGVDRMNFHPIFDMGIPRDNWVGEEEITPDQWVEIYAEIRQNIEEDKYDIKVRIPQRFITQPEFDSNPSYYGYCPVKLGERVEVHPNGQLHVCALHNGTPISMAHWVREGSQLRIKWAKQRNEWEEDNYDMSCDHSCAVMKEDFGEYEPLCISFKPNQDEFVWNNLGVE